MSQAVSAVIATVGRASLDVAVRSVLAQTHPVAEIVVVVDGDAPVELPHDERITLLHNALRSGAASARQRGLEAARSPVAALLDDDDWWYPTKIERQLRAAAADGGPHWIASSRIMVRGPGARERVWPRRLIEPTESIADYLFRFRGLRMGDAVLQTSTLCFPTALARRVPWGGGNGVHDEPSWLLDVQRAVADLRVVQLPETLSGYDVRGASVSRSHVDLTDRCIQWGLDHLRDEDPRVLGDYLCTSPVSAAVTARAPASVGRAVRAAFRHGRPGPPAVGYATLNAIRAAAKAIRAERR